MSCNSHDKVDSDMHLLLYRNYSNVGGSEQNTVFVFYTAGSSSNSGMKMVDPHNRYDLGTQYIQGGFFNWSA